MSLAGKYLVTGAASGIGRAVAHALAQAGDLELVLIDLSESGLKSLENELSTTAVTCLPMDVSSPQDWSQASAHLPGLTGAIACAGISDAAPITEMDFDAWRNVLSVNLDGMFLTFKSTLAALKDGGQILAISSATGEKAAPLTAAYGASKAGLNQLVRVAALEAAPRGITVNAIAPGGVKTPMFSGQAGFKTLAAEKGETAAWDSMASATPLKRFAEPGEIAAFVLNLLETSPGLITGAILPCDGGYGIS